MEESDVATEIVFAVSGLGLFVAACFLPILVWRCCSAGLGPRVPQERRVFYPNPSFERKERSSSHV